MLRTEVALTDDQHERLQRLARESGRSESDLIQEAINRFLAASPPSGDWRAVVARTHGLWADRPEVEDEIARARAELDRRVSTAWPEP